MSKLLLEQYIKEFLKEENENQKNKEDDFPEVIETWGDLRKILNSKKKNKLTHALAKDALNLIPYTQGQNTIKYLVGNEGISYLKKIFTNPKNFEDALTSMYDMNGNEDIKDNPFKINPYASKLIDDDIETAFIKSLSSGIKDRTKFPDDQNIRTGFDMTKLLQMYIKQKIGGANIVTKKTSKSSTSKSSSKDEAPKDDKENSLSPWKT